MSMFALRGGKGKRAEPNYIILWCTHGYNAHIRAITREGTIRPNPITQNGSQK